jgi:taurine dioxygenase
MFANTYRSYEALSDSFKRVLDGLMALHRSDKADLPRGRWALKPRPKSVEEPGVLAAEHPVVRLHSETNKKALYVNAATTVGITGMTEEESDAILNYLYHHQTKPEFTCRFRWSPGTIAFWDNRCTLHNPINDYDGWRRVMHRITISDPPRPSNHVSMNVI